MPAEKYRRLRKKDKIPESVRTDGKDDASETIDELLKSDEWPLSSSEIAEKCDWSRAHIQNTLRDYYEPGESNDSIESDMANLSVDIPDDVDNVSDFLKGVAVGFNLQRKQ